MHTRTVLGALALLLPVHAFAQDPDGSLWCGDNQGDWKAATPLYHLEKGKFYGHPSGLRMLSLRS